MCTFVVENVFLTTLMSKPKNIFHLFCTNEEKMPVRMKKRLSIFTQTQWVLLSCLIASLSCMAQSVRYRELPNQALLPVANVNAIMQDSRGYMWYGTAGGGLCSDDGYTVISYGSQGKGKGVVENDEVTCMVEGKDGTIWMGTRAGAYYIDNIRRKVHQVTDEQVGTSKVNCMCVTPDGCVWLGIAQKVVKLSQTGKVQKVLSIGDNRREEVKEMMVDSKGTLWLTILRGGLASIDPKTDQLTHQPWDYSHAAGFIAEDTVHHCYWVGTWGGGIVRYPDMVVEPATLVTTEKQHFGSEVYNLWIDQQNNLMWVSTMDDIYTYKIQAFEPSVGKGIPLLQPVSPAELLPKGKKIIGKLMPDRRGNIWVPGFSPHTFILAKEPAGSRFYRDEVKAMEEQMGYKIMVHRIAREGDYYWIYQDRTRLSLYHAPTGQLTFMATDAQPTPLSTQRVLSKCVSQPGVWTCNGKHLVHAWHDGMTIHWEEVAEALMPNYISVLSDEGRDCLLIGTERQVFLYNYRNRKVTRLTDSVGIVQQVGWDAQGKLAYTTDKKAPKVITDQHGHVWTLDELTLREESPQTGAYRLLHAQDADMGMDFFTDITLAGDSVCVGGIGAFCLFGSCPELDKVHPDDPVVVTHYDTLRSISVSTLNPLHAADIRFAFRLDDQDVWTELPAGTNVIDISEAGYGQHTLWVKATDEYGVWHAEQEVFQFSMPLPWWLRWYAWCIYVALALGVWRLVDWLRDKRTASRGGTGGVEGEAQGRPLPERMEEKLPSPQELFLAKVEDCIRRHLDNSEYGVDDLCSELGMSRMNLYRRFQSFTDTTPSEYIKAYRLKKAAELLKSSAKSIAEIAYEVGFTSPQYLAKCFKDTYGMSPRAYRTVPDTNL